MFIRTRWLFALSCFSHMIEFETIGLDGDARVRMEIQVGGVDEPHPLVHPHRHLHHVGRMQVQAGGPKPTRTANALLHERGADALTPGLGCDGQKAHLRAGERSLIRGRESGSRGVQENRPEDDPFLFCHDLLGLRYIRQRGQDILPVSCPSGRRHNGCVLLKSSKGYLSGSMAVFTASLADLQLILLFRTHRFFFLAIIQTHSFY